MDTDLANLKFAFEEVREWLGVKMRTGRCSFGLIAELAHHMTNQIYDVHIIYDEIGMLEENDDRISSAKDAREFKHQPLRGLWHKHHHQVAFLAKNMMLEMERSDIINKVLKPHIGNVLTSDIIGNLVHEITIKNYERRSNSRRLTGEWIIFEKEATGNYYLTLGSHNEGDGLIKARVEAYRELDAKLAEDFTA